MPSVPTRNWSETGGCHFFSACLNTMKIYTKTGDQGLTSLLGGTRVKKSHLRIDAYGTVDELNAYLGLLGDQPVNGNRKSFIQEIQDRLFTIGSSLAADPDRSTRKLPDLLEADIAVLEKAIDAMETHIPPLKVFVLPGCRPTAK